MRKPSRSGRSYLGIPQGVNTCHYTPRPEGFGMKDKSTPCILLRLLLLASLEASKKTGLLEVLGDRQAVKWFP
jgi:hypothetical protein